ncbi:MAG: GAF domain-containing protein [Candidatus Dormibacteria bacterium]
MHPTACASRNHGMDIATGHSATASVDIESVVRPILAGLAKASRMQSVYLTSMDWTVARQSIVYAHNDGNSLVTEGVSLPWSNTLCRRSLIDGPSFTSDVQGAWPDASVAIELDLKTFISVPVFDSEDTGGIVGTICAVSSDVVVLGEDTRRLMRFAAQEIARQLRRERELQAARDRAAEAERQRDELELMAADLGRAIQVIQRQRDEIDALAQEMLNS